LLIRKKLNIFYNISHIETTFVKIFFKQFWKVLFKVLNFEKIEPNGLTVPLIISNKSDVADLQRWFLLLLFSFDPLNKQIGKRTKWTFTKIWNIPCKWVIENSISFAYFSQKIMILVLETKLHALRNWVIDR
jgi:hypothetical protein